MTARWLLLVCMTAAAFEISWIPHPLTAARSSGAELLAEECDSEFLQYRLQVGQELVYRLVACHGADQRIEGDSKDGEPVNDQMEWRIVVAGQHDDDSWRLFIRTKMTFYNADGSLRGKSGGLSYCKLNPDGTYSLNEETAIFQRLAPYELFCRLPETKAASRTEWEYAPPVDGKRFTYTCTQSDDTHLQITGIQRDDYSAVHGLRTVNKYVFDTNRGLVTSIVREFGRDAGDPLERRRIVKLSSVARWDAARVSQLQEDAQTYLETHGKWLALCYAGLRSRTLEACQDARAAARSTLEAGRAQAKLDFVREVYDDNIRAHDEDDTWMVGAIQQRDKYYAAANDFPTNWEATGFAKQTFRLAEQRGKVVVLYFWGMNCEYSVLMWDQIKELAAHYKDSNDVIIVGMYDSSEATDDATSVQKYLMDSGRQCLVPNLVANDVAALYKLHDHGIAAPSVLVLNQAGKVHEVQTGYTGDMTAYLQKTIDGLIKNHDE